MTKIASIEAEEGKEAKFIFEYVLYVLVHWYWFIWRRILFTIYNSYNSDIQMKFEIRKKKNESCWKGNTRSTDVR